MQLEFVAKLSRLHKFERINDIEASERVALYIASLEYEARGGGRDMYRRSSLVSLLVALQSEVARLSVLSAISGSVANAIYNGNVVTNTRALIQFFPREAPQCTLIGMRLRKWYADRVVVDILGDMNDKMANSKQATIAFASAGFDVAASDSSIMTELIVSWRKTCAAARKLVLAIDYELSEQNILGVAGEASKLLKVLEDVSQGGVPLVSKDGRAFMPDWAEQREFARIPVRCGVELEAGGVMQSVVLRDMSIIGVGIESVSGLLPGDPVTIHLGKSLELRGIVIWSAHGRAGVTLRQPLQTDDPALSFLTDLSNSDVGSQEPIVLPTPSGD